MAKPSDPQPPPRPVANLGERRAKIHGGQAEESLAPGGGPPHGPSMDARVAILETHMEYVRSDLKDIKDVLAANTHALSGVSNEIAKLPTRKDLWEWKIQWTVMSLAAVALIVGGIIGGLDWIKTH